MRNLQIFNYNGNEIRTIEKDGEPWWVLKDVCSVLGLKNPTVIADRLEEDEVTKFNLGGLSGETNIINESGIYNVILRSDKPEAKPFRKWVTSEVLPSIRKHWAYMTAEKLEEVILNPDMMIKLCTALKEEKDRNKELQLINSNLAVDNNIMKPKAEYFDELVDRNLLTNFRETAKQLHIGEKSFIKFLIDKKYLYRDKRGRLMPYADKNKGLFEMKECFNEKTQ